MMLLLNPYARSARLFTVLLASTGALLFSGCASTPAPIPRQASVERPFFNLGDASLGHELVIYAVGLMDTGYRFGGSNPEAGLDCSGMVSFIVQQISGQRLPHSAAQIAEQTRPIPIEELQPGDLVFFNTMNRPYSHMGIYVGDKRFIHAPSSRGKVRMERLDSSYFAQRLDGARTLFPKRV